MRLKFKSMRFRTTAGFVIIIGLVLACCITTLLTLARNSGELESQNQLHDVAEQAKNLIVKNLAAKSDWKKQVAALAQTPDVANKNIMIVVRRRDHPGPPGPDNPSSTVWTSRPDVPNIPARDPRHPETTERKKFDETYDGTGAGDPKSGFTVLAIRSKAGLQRDLNRRRVDLVLMGCSVVLAVGICAWFIVGVTLSPIRKLAKQADSASAENLYVRLEPPSNDTEVVELVATLNGFLERMAETAESKGRFYAAASHELRTPLQALSGHLELALSRERSADEYRVALQEASKQSGRLKSLVQSLLLLHQLENTQLGQKDSIDVSSVLRAALLHLQPMIEGKKLQVKLDVPEGVQVMAISNHAEILVRNLLENAVKYTPSGKSISIALQEAPAGQELVVFNEAESDPNWKADKVFEAFYRPDAARSGKTGGNGLGLAICRAIAQADDWALKVDQVDGGFEARVLFSKDTLASVKSKKRARERTSATGMLEHPAT